MTGGWIEGVRSLLEAPSPAVLTTYRKDGSALVSPVWFRWSDGWFEVVIAKGDLKLRHLARDPRCILGVEAGARFAPARSSKPGVLLRLAADSPRVWDLSGILPP